jgi:AcrR family transcriptional regulator
MKIALESGIPAVTIASVAERLEVTRAVVYACFADRIAMIEALLAREEQKLLSGVLAAYPTPGRYRAQEAFVRGMQAFLRTVATNPDTWRALFWSYPDPDVAELFSRGRRLVAAQFAELVRPDLSRWETVDADRKLPALVEIFVSISEAGVRALFAPANTYTPDELGEIVGRAAYRAVRHA